MNICKIILQYKKINYNKNHFFLNSKINFYYS